MYLVLYSFRVTVFITLQIYVTLVILPSEIGKFSSDITNIYQVKHRNIIIIRYIAFQKHCKIISEKAFFNIAKIYAL